MRNDYNDNALLNLYIDERTTSEPKPKKSSTKEKDDLQKDEGIRYERVRQPQLELWGNRTGYNTTDEGDWPDGQETMLITWTRRTATEDIDTDWWFTEETGA
jgi:hypothetical protein